MQLLPSDAPSSIIDVVQNENLTRKATVMAVGELVTDLSVGQTVLCRPLTGMEVGDWHLLPTSGILAVVA